MAADVRNVQEQAQQLASTIAALNQAIAESLKASPRGVDAATRRHPQGVRRPEAARGQRGRWRRARRSASGPNDADVRITALREGLEALRSTGAGASRRRAPPPPVMGTPSTPTATATPSPRRLSPHAPAKSETSGPVAYPHVRYNAKADYAAASGSLALTGLRTVHPRIPAFPRERQRRAVLYRRDAFGSERLARRGSCDCQLAIQN